MHWFWWVVIVYVALIIVNKLCEDNPGFRHILCCIIALVYPIMVIINMNKTDGNEYVWLIVGALTLGFYKFVYGLAELIENEGSGDIIGAMFYIWFENEVNFLAIAISILISVAFAAIPVGLFFLFTQFSNFLAYVSLFLPLVYCIIGAVRYYRSEY